MVVVQLLSCVWLSAPPMGCSTQGFSVLHHMTEFAQTHVHRVGDAIQPSRSLLPLLLSSIFPSIRVFSNECKAYQFIIRILAYSLNSYYLFPLSRRVLLGFRLTAKELSYTYTCILSPPNSPPFQAATQHWAEFPGLYSRTVWSSILNTALC